MKTLLWWSSCWRGGRTTISAVWAPSWLHTTRRRTERTVSNTSGWRFLWNQIMMGTQVWCDSLLALYQHNLDHDTQQNYLLVGWMVVFTSHQQRGHLETAPPFTVLCKWYEARFLHHSHRKSNPGPSRGSPLHYRCATPAALKIIGIAIWMLLV